MESVRARVPIGLRVCNFYILLVLLKTCEFEGIDSRGVCPQFSSGDNVGCGRQVIAKHSARNVERFVRISVYGGSLNAAIIEQTIAVYVK